MSVVKALVGGEIGRDDSDQVVGVAEEPLGFDDLRDIGQGCIEVCDCFRAYDGGEDKHLEAQANSGRGSRRHGSHEWRRWLPGHGPVVDSG